MHQPDVILRVNGDTRDRSEDPVIGQRLWPERIDLKRGNRRGSALCGHRNQRDGRAERERRGGAKEMIR